MAGASVHHQQRNALPSSFSIDSYTRRGKLANNDYPAGASSANQRRFTSQRVRRGYRYDSMKLNIHQRMIADPQRRLISGLYAATARY